MKIAVLIMVIAFMSGCSVTGYQLKDNPSGTYEYTVDENYKKVFRRIVTESKRCYENGERRVEANIYDDNQTAEVTLAIVYGGGIQSLYYIEIKAETEFVSKVRGYYSYNISNSWKKGVEDSEQWASGKLNICRYKSS
ncbi:MAG: hypothetical protein AB2689_27280 [Candidatus Thiodiazotropha taylori]